MPWSHKQLRLAQAVEHGFKPTGKAKGFTKKFAEQVVSEGEKGMSNVVDRGGYKKGGVVKKTGLAKVHKGEVVIPAEAKKPVKKGAVKSGLEGWTFEK